MEFIVLCGKYFLMVMMQTVPPQAHIGDLKLNLLNTHLESTGEFARERVEQLKLSFAKMKESPPEVTTIFAGDLNLRDKEVRKNVCSVVEIPPSFFSLFWILTVIS